MADLFLHGNGCRCGHCGGSGQVAAPPLLPLGAAPCGTCRGLGRVALAVSDIVAATLADQRADPARQNRGAS